ncbi:MAG: single-stranded DNA-binding protein [Acidiphilium sp.]|nr:single-stranded DNA-binding protein [Acidiphilium sp.]
MHNQITIIGRIGKDAEIRNMQSGDKTVSFDVATTDSWKDKATGEWKEHTQWHKCVSFQQALIPTLEKRAKKGSLVFIQGSMTYRSYRKDGESTDRTIAEIKIGPDGSIRFLEKSDSREENHAP